MRPEQGNDSFLWDMLDAARAIQEFIAGKNLDAYMGSRLLRGAVERHLEIIGEAARKLPRDVREKHPDIPWGAIIAQRNVLAHEYGEIRHERIWVVATTRIPELIRALQGLFGDNEFSKS
jgi:uncharacterized protein with HEPN domain